MTAANTGFFAGSQNFTVSGGVFTEVHGNNIVNYIGSAASEADQIAPLPPMKHSSAFFTGRHSYLQVLHDHFSSHTETQRKYYLLYGMGGIGKTQICLKFIEKSAHLFSDIFWIDASSESAIDLRLRQIAKGYNVSTTESAASAHSALEWIATRKNWLIVYDNADGGYEVVEKFLPPGNGGNVLVTSRNKALRRITLDKNSIEVDRMDEEEAVSLFLQSAMHSSPSEETRALARSIVLAMGHIPLAIDQAGAYIQATGCDLDYYLNLYNQHCGQLMSSTTFKGASDYGYSTYGTWEISMQEIEKRASMGTGPEALAAQSAITLHKVFAFLHNDNISEEIFRNAAKNYMKRDIKEEEKLGLPLSITLLNPQALFLDAEGEWDNVHFLAGIQILVSFSLIKSTNKLYSVHPLVHTWSRDRIPKLDISTVHGITRAILACSINMDVYDDNHAFCGLLVPHIRECYTQAEQLKLKKMYYIDECTRFAFVFDRVADWNEVEDMQTYVVEARRSKLNADHPDTLTSIGNLALTYRNQGRLDEAKNLQVHVMEITKAKLGADHPDTLNSMANLASTYRDQAKWDEAENLQMYVMRERKAKLGVGHPSTLSSMGNLASTYRDQGRWNEAEKLQVQVMETTKEKLGACHPDTLTSMGNLAHTYRNQGRWNEAEKLQVHVMEATKAKLGANHPHTLTSMANLASTYRNQGRWNEAETLQVHVMETSKAKLGAGHPETLNGMANLAYTYWNQGRLDEAEKLEVYVVEARKAKFGADHPHTLTSMGNLAYTYRYQG
ncbi:hypothetical protein AX15_003152, partial [Amanita polypyramis BW_CC]